MDEAHKEPPEMQRIDPFPQFMNWNLAEDYTSVPYATVEI